MKNTNSKNKLSVNAEAPPAYRYIFTYIISALALFSIFAVRLHIFSLSGDWLRVFSSDGGLQADWFLYVKEIIYFALACVICLYAAGERIFPDKPYISDNIRTKEARPAVCCICVYFTAAVLSAVFSSHRDVVLWGMATEFEGLAAIFAYCILFLFGFNYISGRAFSTFKKLLLVLTGVTSALAVVEYLTVPLMTLPFMKYVIAPAKYRSAAESITSSNDFREAVLMFHNANYTGGFFVLVFPVSLYVLITAKNWGVRIAGALLSVAALAGCIMSNSTAAFYILLAESALMLVFALIKRLVSVKGMLAFIGTAAAAALVLNIATGSDYLDNIVKSFTNAGSYSAEYSDVYRLRKIDIDGFEIHISGEGSSYVIVPPVEEGQMLTVSAGDGSPSAVERIDNNNVIVYDGDSGCRIAVSVNSGILSIDCGYKNTIDFAVTTEGSKAIMQNARLSADIPESPFNDTWLFDYYSFATGRGYIWLNTLPILKSCLLIGKGCGNFPLYFEQDDIVGLCNTHGTYHIVTDKPHSLYLQIGVTCGIPALIAVIVLFGLFIFRGLGYFIKTDRKRLSADPDKLFLFCLMVGIFGFMAAGLVNDSIDTVNPVFWLCFGAAFGSLSIFRKEAEAK